MDFQKNLRLGLSLVMIVTFHSVHSQLPGTDCNGKTYYCVDEQTFQVCIDLPGVISLTVDELAYPCPANSFCDNAGQMECDSQTRPTATIAAASITTNTSADSTTQVTTSTSSVATSTTEYPFVCTEAGKFPNSNDCHKYYTCRSIPQGLSQSDSSCFFGMAFNPVSQLCSSDQSPCQQKFTCTSLGRFIDPSDSGSYYWCLWSGSQYTMYHMSCENGQIFDAEKGRCAELSEVKQSDAGPRRQIMRIASPGRGGYN